MAQKGKVVQTEDIKSVQLLYFFMGSLFALIVVGLGFAVNKFVGFYASGLEFKKND